MDTTLFQRDWSKFKKNVKDMSLLNQKLSMKI